MTIATLMTIRIEIVSSIISLAFFDGGCPRSEVYRCSAERSWAWSWNSSTCLAIYKDLEGLCCGRVETIKKARKPLLSDTLLTCKAQSSEDPRSYSFPNPSAAHCLSHLVLHCQPRCRGVPERCQKRRSTTILLRRWTKSDGFEVSGGESSAQFGFMMGSEGGVS